MAMFLLLACMAVAAYAGPSPRTCLKERGYCVGHDLKSGVQMLDKLNRHTAQREVDCLRLCNRVPGATACELVWNTRNAGCYVHTRYVTNGNGQRGTACWVFSKCSDQRDYRDHRDHRDRHVVYRDHRVDYRDHRVGVDYRDYRDHRVAPKRVDYRGDYRDHRVDYRDHRVDYRDHRVDYRGHRKITRTGGRHADRKIIGGRHADRKITVGRHADRRITVGRHADRKITVGSKLHRERGYCVPPQGRTTGYIQLDSLSGYSRTREEECLRKCRGYRGATGCELVWDNHSFLDGCYVLTRELVRGSGTPGYSCWIFQRTGGSRIHHKKDRVTTRITDVRHTKKTGGGHVVHKKINRERGYCVSQKGRATGFIKLDSFANGNTAKRQEACLEKCRIYPSATGCEIAWQRPLINGCYVLTGEVVRGSDSPGYSCWVF